MWRYWGALGLMVILSGCAAATYPDYYPTYRSYPYGGEPYFYDQLYGPPFAYPYPDYYYYQAPTIIPTPLPTPVPTPVPGPTPRGHFRWEHDPGGRGGSHD